MPPPVRLRAWGHNAMPIYDYKCPTCGHAAECLVAVRLRDSVYCGVCEGHTDRQLTVAPGRVGSRVSKSSAAGFGRHTADMLGIPVTDLPDGLRHDRDRLLAERARKG